MKKSFISIFILLFITVLSLFIFNNSKNNKNKVNESKNNHKIEENKEEESNKEEENKIKNNNKTEEKILKIAISTDLDSLDPFISAAADTSSVLKNIFEGLVKIDESGDIKPQIAKKWNISEDGLKYTFLLKDNIKFHNGKNLKAEDVVYSYKKLATSNSRFENIEDVKLIDDYKIEITLKNKDYSFIYRVVEAVIPNNYEDSKKHPIGTGPYKFVKYEPTKKIILKKFEDYYNKLDSINNVEFLFIPDDNAKLLALKSGEVHMFSASEDIANQVKDNDKFSIDKHLSNTIQLLALNNDKEPFNNEKVRKALNFAIDRDAILKITSDGNSKKIYTGISPIMAINYNKETEKIYTYDKLKAIKLLKDAGYEKGFNMEIKVPSNYKIHVDTAQIIADQLSQVGIKVKIKQVEWATWLDEIYKKRDYQSTLVGLGGKQEIYESLIRFCSYYPKNFAGYNNKEYDECIKNAILEENEKSRKEYYNKAQMILTEDAVAVFLQDISMNIVSIKELKGYKQYIIPFWDLSNLRYE